MSQGVLPFQYEDSDKKLTSYAGLPLFLDLFAAMKLSVLIERHVELRPTQGWSDSQQILAVVLLNLAGGEHVDDLEHLNHDPGFATVLRESETHGMRPRERRAFERRFRRGRLRAVPSASTLRRYLEAFHDPAQEEVREEHTAFIPAPNVHLQGLYRVNAEIVAFAQRYRAQRIATLDTDATLVESHKSEARFCYKGFPGYQPLQVYCFELGLVLHSEFRDGNVPAGHQQLRVFEQALGFLPESVAVVRMRSDTAGYQWELLQYCAEGRNPRFGVIEFAVGADVTPAFKLAVSQLSESEWQPLYDVEDGMRFETGQQFAEVPFVPNEVAKMPKGHPRYRYLAIREPLPEDDSKESSAFPTMEFASHRRFKLFALVSNRLQMPSDELIWWSRERCGDSERIHSSMKSGLAGGTLPSGLFGANAAWWACMILAFNLSVLMQRYVLVGSWATKRLKALRFKLYNVAGWVTRRARRLRIKVSRELGCFEVLLQARRRLLSLAAAAAP